MPKLYNKILLIFCVIFFIQACSVDGIVFGGGDKKKLATIGATENRRIPAENPTIEEISEPSKVNDNPPVQYLNDDDQQAYQDYQANAPPKDFTKFRKQQREAELKALSLNQSMNMEASAFKESQATNNSIQIDGQSNLSEIIEYNKKQKSKSIDNQKAKAAPKSSEVKKEPQVSKKSKAGSNKKDSSNVVVSSSKEESNNKKTTIVTLKSSSELTPESESGSKKKKSSSVTPKEQNKSSANNKHKVSVKPVVAKKTATSSAKNPVAPVVKKDEVGKKSKTLEVLAEPADVNKVSSNDMSSSDSKKISAVPVDPIKNKEDSSNNSEASKEVTEKVEEPKKDSLTKTKADVPVKVPEIFKNPIIDSPLLTNKDEYNDVPATYLVVDPSEVVGGSVIAEQPGESILVNPFVEDNSKEVVEDKPKEVVEERSKEESSKTDIRNLSHDEFKKALKEKFQKNNSNKHVSDTEMDGMSSIEIMDDNAAQ